MRRTEAAESRRGRVGLALGSGAARGLAQIGVLEVLQEEGIPVDMIAGTSAGALIGALYAQGKSVGEIKDLAIMDADWKRLVPLVDLTLPKTGFIEGKRIKGLLRSIIGDITFEELRIPFACVTTDIQTGEEVVVREGSVVEGVRASISLPVIFTLVKLNGRYLVDGGLVNPVPVSVVREMGADFIIAVNVTPDITGRIHRADDLKRPNIFSIIIQAIYIASYSLVRSSLEGADIIIEPRVAHIGYGEFHRARDLILQGELAARSALPELKRRLKTRAKR